MDSGLTCTCIRYDKLPTHRTCRGFGRPRLDSSFCSCVQRLGVLGSPIVLCTGNCTSLMEKVNCLEIGVSSRLDSVFTFVLSSSGISTRSTGVVHRFGTSASAKGASICRRGVNRLQVGCSRLFGRFDSVRRSCVLGGVVTKCLNASRKLFFSLRGVVGCTRGVDSFAPLAMRSFRRVQGVDSPCCLNELAGVGGHLLRAVRTGGGGGNCAIGRSKRMGSRSLFCSVVSGFGNGIILISF